MLIIYALINFSSAKAQFSDAIEVTCRLSAAASMVQTVEDACRADLIQQQSDATARAHYRLAFLFLIVGMLGVFGALSLARTTSWSLHLVTAAVICSIGTVFMAISEIDLTSGVSSIWRSISQVSSWLGSFRFIKRSATLQKEVPEERTEWLFATATRGEKND